MIDSDNEQPELFTRRWLLLMLLSLVPFYSLFAFLGYPGKGRAAGICAAAIITAVRARWEVRKQLWFWVAVGILSALHVPLILLIPWTTASYPAFALLPVAVVDFAIVYGCIRLAEKAIGRSKPLGGERSLGE